MITPDPRDFIVDLHKRVVRHKSGAIIDFAEYPTEEGWLAAAPSHIHNPDLYPGPESELARVSKEVAVACGMKCRQNVKAPIKVHRFKIWDVVTGDYIVSHRLATSEAIAKANGVAIEDTAIDIDRYQLNSDGMTEIDFDI